MRLGEQCRIINVARLEKKEEIEAVESAVEEEIKIENANSTAPAISEEDFEPAPEESEEEGE